MTFTLLLCVVILIHARLALIFPHAAVTGRISFASAWNAMKGNVLRFLAAFLLLAPLILVAYPMLEAALLSSMTWQLVLMISPAPRGLLTAWLVLSAAAIPLRAIALAMIVALISYAYRDLVQGEHIPAAAENRP